jgi:predicted DNA-binding protein YlxM (UPF0122 family)
MSCDYAVMYLAIIGDIVGSRAFSVKARRAIQGKLIRAISDVNRGVRGKADIEAEFVITTGDEFQGLLKAGADPLWFARFIQNVMGDEPRLRFGIGKGELATKGMPEKALGIDGPCFHNARDAIDAAKKDDVTCRVKGFGEIEPLLEILTEIFFAEYWDLTEKQREIYNLYYFHGYDVSEIQNRFKYRTSRYIYKVLAKREVKLMGTIEEKISGIFKKRVFEIR